MNGRHLAHLALGAGIVAGLIQISNDAPGVLAWPFVVIGAGLWLAAAWEARAGRENGLFALCAGGLALAGALGGLVLLPG